MVAIRWKVVIVGFGKRAFLKKKCARTPNYITTLLETLDNLGETTGSRCWTRAKPTTKDLFKKRVDI